jgi:hypothetical protein
MARLSAAAMRRKRSKALDSQLISTESISARTDVPIGDEIVEPLGHVSPTTTDVPNVLDTVDKLTIQVDCISSDMKNLESAVKTLFAERSGEADLSAIEESVSEIRSEIGAYQLKTAHDLDSLSSMHTELVQKFATDALKVEDGFSALDLSVSKIGAKLDSIVSVHEELVKKVDSDALQLEDVVCTLNALVDEQNSDSISSDIKESVDQKLDIMAMNMEALRTDNRLLTDDSVRTASRVDEATSELEHLSSICSTFADAKTLMDGFSADMDALKQQTTSNASENKAAMEDMKTGVVNLHEMIGDAKAGVVNLHEMIGKLARKDLLDSNKRSISSLQSDLQAFIMTHKSDMEKLTKIRVDMQKNVNLRMEDIDAKIDKLSDIFGMNQRAQQEHSASMVADISKGLSLLDTKIHDSIMSEVNRHLESAKGVQASRMSAYESDLAALMEDFTGVKNTVDALSKPTKRVSKKKSSDQTTIEVTKDD